MHFQRRTFKQPTTNCKKSVLETRNCMNAHPRCLSKPQRLGTQKKLTETPVFGGRGRRGQGLGSTKLSGSYLWSPGQPPSGDHTEDNQILSTTPHVCISSGCTHDASAQKTAPIMIFLCIQVPRCIQFAISGLLKSLIASFGHQHSNGKIVMVPSPMQIIRLINRRSGG